MNSSTAAWGKPVRPKMGVAIGPGLTTFTRIPRFTNSEAKVRASERTAAFVAAYTLPLVVPLELTTEEFSTMPALSFRCGSDFWRVKYESFHIGVEGLVKQLLVAVGHRSELGDAGIGKQSIDLPELFGDLREELVDFVEL